MGRKAWDIAGYTYNAETLCQPCTRRIAAFANEANGRNAEFVGIEDLLDQWAVDDLIVREDEHSFDSDDFPKVVLVSSLLDGETCDKCGEELW